ncbi:hypothetical protein N0V88_001884 [Collariella sp. IMI 366227]|nr:hypothetical protein N0V88_001884 [Collariella sp. IMI 366227]
MEILFPSLKVGAIAGTCGLLVGAAGGIVRSAPTWMFSILSGGQWFTLGTSFYAVMFSLFGAGGQAIANWRAAKAANAPPSTGQGFWSRWSPIKALTDEDYVNLLEDKLLRVEADIAIVDEHIKELRESASQPKKAQYQEPSASNPPSSKQP